MNKVKFNILVAVFLVAVMLSSVFPGQLLANEKVGEITGSIVNVRKGPSTKDTVISKVTQGQYVTILDEQNNWFKIKLTDGKTGWAAGWLVNDQLADLETAVVSEEVVNVRQGPGTTYAKVTQLKAGEKLTILKSEKDWYLVKLADGQQGWIANWLVKTTRILGVQVGSVNGSAVNVRKGANTTYPLLFQLNKGQQVTIKDEKDGWYLIETSDGTGWVAGWLINLPGSTKHSRNAIVSGSIVNVRQGPSTETSKVAQVKQGEKVEIIGENKDWYQIETSSGEQGWIANWLLSFETSPTLSEQNNTEKPNTNSNTSQSSANFTEIKKVLVTGNVVNIRTGAGLDNPVVSKVNAGTELSVVGQKEDWLQVKLNNGQLGWIAQWLTVDKNSSPLPQPNNYTSEIKLTLDNGRTLILKNLGDKLGVYLLGVDQEQYKIASNDNQISIALNGVKLQPITHPLDNWGIKEIKVSEKNVNIFFNKKFTHETKYSASSRSVTIDINYPAEELIPVKQIKLSPQKDQAVVQIAAGGKINYTTKEEAPNRVVIDLPQSSLQLASNSDTEQNVAFGPIRKVTSRQLSPDLVRVEAEFAPGTKYQVTQQDDYIVVGARLSGGSLAGKRIVIDPGHGSIQPGGWTDPGAIGKYLGVYERNVNLNVALKVRDLLTQQGAKVVMTHSTGSTYLSLAGRADVANNINADIFVSIHSNSTGNRAIGGSSVYYYAPTWHSELASQRWIRQRLALSIQDELVRYGGRRDIGIIEENFAVLRYTKVPSVLVEMAYLSNQEEERLLNTDAFRAKMATGIVKGIEKYFQSL